MSSQKKILCRRIVDIGLIVCLIMVMYRQVTGDNLHEWSGIFMAAFMVIHQILNRGWYKNLLKGRYSPYRALLTVADILLFVSFALTILCGISMSMYAVPFLHGVIDLSFARRMHLPASYWMFLFAGFHVGLHIRVDQRRFPAKIRCIIRVFCWIAGGYGFYLFLKTGIPDYMFFRTHFAFYDYEKSAGIVLLETLLIFFFWVVAGCEIRHLLLLAEKKDTEPGGRKKVLHPIAGIILMVLIGVVLVQALSGKSVTDTWNDQAEQTENVTKDQTEEVSQGTTENETQEQDVSSAQGTSETATEVSDGYILLEGGSFLMGSPETENWRGEDEIRHQVDVAGFYIDPCETTQEEYQRIIGQNPSSFSGKDLPVESISWLEAIQFANEKSRQAGLIPAYTLTEDTVTWDRSADGYRLPTEAEWEYACRAGTETPFNTEKSLSAEEANFYGHYPYEIEENYFDPSSLEAQPGEYRQTTVAVDSFQPNSWGLYNMHGNVNEWCWDYYGAYDAAKDSNPTGPDSGTRHVYRGGGWNDFGKNLRSAYRAAGQSDMKSSNLGVRLVRNAGNGIKEVVTAHEQLPDTPADGRILIAYFSWSGNTRGIAQEIQRQTGADLFEICPKEPYSTDYNTVLMQAQQDQHDQARPELDAHIDDMDQYNVILLGYPNWWASIPMPVASFLEEYDFSGKRIVPFCSNGGGGLGQSITAIAKLAPDAELGEGLSIHYSGGAEMPGDVARWLEKNQVEGTQ
jgi:formylglycine-generating enzyme required for sulfatase activity/flavodoxin